MEPSSHTSHLPIPGANGSKLPKTPPSSVALSFRAASSSVTDVQLNQVAPPRAAQLEDLASIEETIEKKYACEDSSESFAKLGISHLSVALGFAIGACLFPPLLLASMIFGALGLECLIVSIFKHKVASAATSKIEAHAQEKSIDPQNLLKLIERRAAALVTDRDRSLENLEKRAKEMSDNSPIKEDLLYMLNMSKSTHDPNLRFTYCNIAAYMIEKTELLSAELINDDEFNRLLSKATREQSLALKTMYADYQAAMQKFTDNPNDKFRFEIASDLFYRMNNLRDAIEQNNSQYK